MNNKIVKKLSKISLEMPKEFSSKLMKKVYMTPAMKETAERVMESKDVPKKKRDRVKHLYDTGHFSREIEVVDEEIAKKAEKWMEKRIKKAIADGELPDPKKDKETQEWAKKIWKKHQKSQKKK